MLDAQHPYGPHARGAWSGNDIALGRCLFRTVPEDFHDEQPLVCGRGRYILVADVRLDNREDLLARLGCQEKLALSDAQLLLKAWLAWEERALDHVVGAYAFALWDRARDKLLLVRDPVGDRPLFYAERSGYFAFSSMPKGLHALPGFPRAPDPARLAEFVGLIPERGRGSYYAEISSVLPGHVVAISRSAVRQQRYWAPEPRELKLGSFEDYRDAYREQLDTAVRSRLRGVSSTVATHLSSGWDSSAVTATAARLLSNSSAKVDAFTSAPREGSVQDAPKGRIADESAIAARTAAMHPNIEHLIIRGAGASPLDNLDRYVELFDRPVHGLCNFPWLTAIREQAASRGNTVLLTGQLGNYTISSAPFSILADLVRTGRWADWWREARALARRGPTRYRGIAANSFGPWLPDRVWRLVRPLSSRPETAAFSALHPRLEAQIEARREQMGIGLASRPSRHAEAILEGLTSFDKANYRKGVLAGWGLDERDPTGDRRVIEFCLSLPIDLLLKNGVRRPLARSALADRLPPEVLGEPRKGYQAADWHEGMTAELDTIRARIEEMAADPLTASIVDVDRLRGLAASWPDGGWSTAAVLARYRNALLIGLSAGRFIRAASAA